MWDIHTMESYSALKNNVILKFVGKWMKLEKHILREVTETRKDKYSMSSLICKTKDNQPIVHSPRQAR